MPVYRRHQLPHIHPVGATFSIIILVNDAVPRQWLQQLSKERQSALARIKKERFPGWRKALVATQLEFDRRFDDLLRKHAGQDHPLADHQAASIVVNRLKEFDGKLYDLYAYSVMSNHVHFEIDLSVQLPEDWDGFSIPPGYINIPKIMQLIKGGSSFYVNKALGTQGRKLWNLRYRDRFIRNEKHLETACFYTRNNPVAAGLYTRQGLHPFTGGMDQECIDARHHRRVFPDVGLWVMRLLERNESKNEYNPRLGRGRTD